MIGWEEGDGTHPAGSCAVAVFCNCAFALDVTRLPPPASACLSSEQMITGVIMLWDLREDGGADCPPVPSTHTSSRQWGGLLQHAASVIMCCFTSCHIKISIRLFWQWERTLGKKKKHIRWCLCLRQLELYILFLFLNANAGFDIAHRVIVVRRWHPWHYTLCELYVFAICLYLSVYFCTTLAAIVATDCLFNFSERGFPEGH